MSTGSRTHPQQKLADVPTRLSGMTKQQVCCLHKEKGHHWFEFKYVENRSVWNPFWATCTKCGVSIQQVTESIPAMLEHARQNISIQLQSYKSHGFLGDVEDPIYIAAMRIETLGFEGAHALMKCGHARGDYRDPEYGTTAYAGNEKCVGCQSVEQAKLEAFLEAEALCDQWGTMHGGTAQRIKREIHKLAEEVK